MAVTGNEYAFRLDSLNRISDDQSASFPSSSMIQRAIPAAPTGPMTVQRDPLLTKVLNFLEEKELFTGGD